MWVKMTCAFQAEVPHCFFSLCFEITITFLISQPVSRDIVEANTWQTCKDQEIDLCCGKALRFWGCFSWQQNLTSLDKCMLLYNWYLVTFWGFPSGSDHKESACNAGEVGSVPGLGRSPGEGNGYPLSILAWEIPRGAWWATVHRVAKSQIWLSD